MATSAGADTAGVAAEIVVEAGAWPARARLRGLARRALEAAAFEVADRLAPGAEAAVVFTDDAHMRKLNRRYRSKDKPTNVLSFPTAAASRGRHGPLLGDIFLGHETVRAEAEVAGIAFDAHLIHLIVHGFLHLTGYDHVTAADAVVMEGLERTILAQLGIADPYAEGGGTATV